MIYQSYQGRAGLVSEKNELDLINEVRNMGKFANMLSFNILLLIYVK